MGHQVIRVVSVALCPAKRLNIHRIFLLLIVIRYGAFAPVRVVLGNHAPLFIVSVCHIRMAVLINDLGDVEGFVIMVSRNSFVYMADGL